jgi:hypothetical protein
MIYGVQLGYKYRMIGNSTTLRVVTTKPDSSIEFYKDVAVMNHVLNEYILPSKLVAVTRKADDGLTVTTTLNFASKACMNEFLTDPIIKEFGKAKQEYNIQHNISNKTEAVNE